MADYVRLTIDPGKSGGIVWSYKTTAGEIVQDMKKCPSTVDKHFTLVKSIKDKALKDLNNPKFECVIEKVWGRPSDGGSRAFVFGFNYGCWCMALTANNIKYKEVAPVTWMKHVGPLPKKKDARKRVLQKIAQTAYPNFRITLATADAAAIMSIFNKVK
jgi:hypothetical protein